MNEKYDILFTGKILPNFDLEKVIHDFSKISKLDIEKTKGFIDRSSPVYFKRSLSKDSAIKYKSTLEKIGLNIEIKQKNETPNTNTNTPREVEYGPIDKVKSFFYSLEITRRFRIRFSLAISALALISLLFVNLSGDHNFKVTDIILSSFALLLGLTLLLYVLSGILQINPPYHRYRLLIVMLIFLAFRLFNKVYIHHYSIARTLVITLVAWAAMIIAYRVVLHIKGE